MPFNIENETKFIFNASFQYGNRLKNTFGGHISQINQIKKLYFSGFFDKNNNQKQRITFQVNLLAQRTCSLVYIIFNACFQYASGKQDD